MVASEEASKQVQMFSRRLKLFTQPSQIKSSIECVMKETRIVFTEDKTTVLLIVLSQRSLKQSIPVNSKYQSTHKYPSI